MRSERLKVIAGLSRAKLRGFTLVELLVVIAIISLLSSIVLASLGSARIAAQDVIRINDLHQIQIALELYYHDHGYYPSGFSNPVMSNGASNWNSGNCISGINWCDFEATLVPTYFAKLPVDPWIDPDGVYGYYSYRTNESHQMYGLMAHLRSVGNVSFMAQDRGYYSDYYEIGDLPSYCVQKYGSGNNGKWYVNGVSACAGGN